MSAPKVRIEIAAYKPRWPVMFEDERATIISALGMLVESIEHIGSTSVLSTRPGLSAKPIIDLLVTVARLGPVDPYVEPLGSLG